MKPLKISLVLDLQEITSMVEFIPEGHPLLPYLMQKRNVLLHAERIRHLSEQQEVSHG